MSNFRLPPKLCRPKPPAKCHQVRAWPLWRAGGSTRPDAEEPEVGWVGRRGRISDKPPSHTNLTPTSGVPKSSKRTSKRFKPRGEERSGNEQKYLGHYTQVIHEQLSIAIRVLNDILLPLQTSCPAFEPESICAAKLHKPPTV